MWKKYDQQNFNNHVLLCHSDDQGVKSQDIRSMFLTMIAQDQRDKNENEQQEQIDITDDTALIGNSFWLADTVKYDIDRLSLDDAVVMLW